MITILTSDTTGEVLAVQGTRTDGTPGPAPLARKGATLRTVDAIPPGPGKLHWTLPDGPLVRVVALPPVPAVISPAQLREWLIRAGKLDAVNAALAAIPDATERAVMQSWFEFASEVRRDNPKVLALAQALGMSADQVDAAFRAAALL